MMAIVYAVWVELHSIENVNHLSGLPFFNGTGM